MLRPHFKGHKAQEEAVILLLSLGFRELAMVEPNWLVGQPDHDFGFLDGVFWAPTSPSATMKGAPWLADVAING